MDYKEFNCRKKEIQCDICCSDLLGDLLDNEDKEMSLLFLCRLFDYVEDKAKRTGRIELLKYFRRLKRSDKN